MNLKDVNCTDDVKILHARNDTKMKIFNILISISSIGSDDDDYELCQSREKKVF